MAAKHLRLIDKNAIPCPKCRGTGEIKVKTWTATGSTMIPRPCDTCEGTGQIYAVRVSEEVERRR